MDDRQIQELAKMVMEVEALERAAAGEDADAPFAQIGPGVATHGPVRRLLVGAGMGLAAAACLVLGLVMMRPTPPTVAPGPSRPIAKGTTGPSGADSPRIVATAAEDCVVMSMFRDNNGRCSCLQVSEPKWEGGRKLADVSRSELHRVALSSPCDNEAQQVIIVAVAGRADTLPRSHEQAEAIAQQLTTAAASVGRHVDVSSFARAAMPGLSDGATVVAESVSMRQPSRVKDLLPSAPSDWK